jgi:Ca2+-binding EF-hand superfamily protein
MKTPASLAALAAILLAGAALAEGPAMAADTNGDGKISKEEMSAAHSTRVEERFARLDLDKDGFVTSEELKQAKETRHGDLRGKLEERFKTADANGDGQISLDEAQANLPRVAEKFSEIDADQNGSLTREELRNARQKRHQPAL